MDAKSVTIAHVYEECDCEYCGEPLFVNDRGYLCSDDRGEVFVCSRKCGEAALARELARNQQYYASHLAPDRNYNG